MGGALEGIRVLDLTRVLSGPYASLLLADMGAEIIKIEPPEGDETRTFPPYFYKGTSAYFLTLNRNKKSIVIDLKTEAGREVFYDLVKVSDLVFDNYRPGILERLKIDYETLRNTNPKIISCSLTGYGSSGPYKDRPSYDVIIQAISGGMSITGEPGRPPVRAGIAIADLAGGMFAAYGIVCALVTRERTGAGQRVETSLLAGQISLLTYVAGFYFNSGKVPGPLGSGHPSLAPYQAFRAKDRYIVMDAHLDKVFAKLCRILGQPELAGDPRFNSMGARLKNKGELIPILEELFLTRTGEEWVRILSEEGIPAAPVNTIDKALSDPQVLHENMVVELDHVLGGKLKGLGNPLKMFGGTAGVYLSPPLLGQHTEEVLSGILSYPPERIAKLREEKVILVTTQEEMKQHLSQDFSREALAATPGEEQ